MKSLLDIRWLGTVDYQTALTTMDEHRERLISGDASAARVMLLEHPPVITLGRHARAEHVVLDDSELDRLGIGVHKISRGGDVTYHGPGQLMIYPIVKIDMRISTFLEGFASVLSQVASGYGVGGAVWRSDPAGLWLEKRKIGACGLHIRKGVCIHGFAFNVSTPPAAWSAIVPCGLVGAAPVSLAEAMGSQQAPTVEEFAGACTSALRDFLVA